ncbi:MAG TPA: TonB-dependent receptor plug domain-containing protein [Pyrinomonadaceae bacterium]|nr:TonB-dependent receptor plug domain-containing protein [Pyrinomonadaceae bacterium]
MGRRGDEMRIIYFSTLFLIFFATVSGQSGSFVVEGTVTDANGPVGGAIVSIRLAGESEPIKKAVSDAKGTYRLTANPGRYVVQAQMVVGGSQFLSGTNSVEGIAGERVVLDLKIPPVSTINEIVTVSAGEVQQIDEVSKTVNVITGQEMRERGDFSLADSLRTIPGFRVQQLGGFGKTASIKTRGLRNQDTAVLIDGIRFRDASSITGDATPFLSDFTLTSVSRIEVLRGSGSSLYGTNAIGGVVDFQTPSPQPGLHGQISGATGGLGLGRIRGNVSDATSDGKIGFNLGVSRTVYTKGIDGDDEARNTNFQSRLDFQPTSKTSLSGRVFVSDAFVRLNTNPDTFGSVASSNFDIIDAKRGFNFTPDVDDPDDFQKSKFFNGQIVFSQIVTPELVLQAYYSGLKTSRQNETGPLGAGFQSSSTSLFDGLIQTANAHFDWSPKGINRITAGYEFENEKFGNDGSTPDAAGNFFTRAYQSSNTFYVQDLVALLNGKLNLAGGFRLQQFRLSDPKFSTTDSPYANLKLENPPNAYTFDGSVSYYFERSGTKVRAHVGNGYRVPSLFERFGTFFNTFTFPEPARFEILGDPKLKPERSIAFDGGIEQNLFKGKTKLTAVYFYTKLIDTIGFGNVMPPIGNTPRFFGGYENQKGGLARGGEFSATVKPTGSTDIFASYTYTNSDQREPQVVGSGVTASLGIPAHQFTAVVTQRIKRFWVNFDFLATNSYLAPVFSSTVFNSYVYRFSGNRRVDLTAGYTFPFRKDKLNLRLFGTVENLFDYEYFESGFRTVGRNGRVGMSLGF